METHARYIAVGAFVLAIIIAGFGFVYWLNNSGELGAQSIYRVGFETPISGLQIGAAVEFNGIRVGEVTGLSFDKGDPRRVIATIAIDQNIPLRADTKVSVVFQGLMGSPAILLTGGSANSPLLASNPAQPPFLAADPEATQDLTQAARQTLQHVDNVLQDNAASIKSTIDNLKTFSSALARNSDKVDAILAGLEHLTGGGPAEKPKPIYDLTVPATFPSQRTVPHAQLAVAMPTAIVALQTQRMLSRTPEGEISQLGDAQWGDALPNLIQAKIVEGFDNAGFLVAAAAPEQQLASNNELLIDIRDFAIALDPEPLADIEFSAKILDQNGHIIATKLFRATAPAKGTDAAQIAAAFDQAFGRILIDLVAWTSQSM